MKRTSFIWVIFFFFWWHRKINQPGFLRREQATLSIAAPLLGIILLTRLASWFGQQPRLFCSASIILCRLLPRCRDSAFVVFVGSPKETKNVSYSYAKMPIHCARWQYTKRPNANGWKEGLSETSGWWLWIPKHSGWAHWYVAGPRISSSHPSHAWSQRV